MWQIEKVLCFFSQTSVGINGNVRSKTPSTGDGRKKTSIGFTMIVEENAENGENRPRPKTVTLIKPLPNGKKLYNIQIFKTNYYPILNKF